MTGLRYLLICLAITALALISAGALAIAFALLPAMDGARTLGLVALCVAVGLTALAFGAGRLGHHFRRLEGLRGAVLSLGQSETRIVPILDLGSSDRELIRFKSALEELAVTLRALSDRPDERLAAVLAALREAMVVITEDGLVSLVNAAAKTRLGPERIALGTSVFAALRRGPVAAALMESLKAGGPVAATLETADGEEIDGWVVALPDLGGGVISLPAPAEEAAQAVDHDLALHDQPPQAATPEAGTALRDLPALAFDCETTGLDVTKDRIISLGAVRLHGPRLYRSRLLDLLVDPACPIPRRSTAVHGITDEMVRGAPGFAAVFPRFLELQGQTVLIGHNIPFDIAMVRRECALSGLSWQPPAFIDIFPLAVALEPGLPGYSLDALADWLGVEIRGRHTALGDSLVTAEVYQRLLPRLADRGVTTLAAAQGLAAEAKGIIKQQRAMGWSEGAPDEA